MSAEDDILGKAYDARLMRRLLRYLRPYMGRVALALATIVIGAGLALVPPWLTRQVIDVHIPAGDLGGLTTVGLLYLATLAGEFALEFVETSTLQSTGQRIMFDLRMQIYAHLQRLDIRFYDRHPVGRLMTRVTTDVDALNELFTSGVVSVFGDVFTLVGIMAVMLALDWQLALVAFSVLPLIGLVAQWFRTHVRESYREVRLWIARINAFLQEHITGVATLQLFRQEATTYARFERIDRSHRDANVKSIFYYAVFYPAVELVGALAAALLLWHGGGRVLQDTLTLGTLVAFIQYSQRFFRPISDLSEKFNILQAAMASSERIFTLLDTEVEIGRAAPVGQVGQSTSSAHAACQPHPAALPHPPLQAGQAIKFENVWFAYQDDDFVLRDVSFEVRTGERVGLVGATGAGKTTILNLLLRFYDVSRGRITVGGVDIRDMSLEELRSLYGLVLQDVHLFSGTIRSNVRLGNGNMSDEVIERALGAVHADRFIAALPGGLDAPVAERGATLSVGQKQLLSFARALAFDASVLVLDEATSSVDTETEWQIRDALATLMHGRTTIAIAHRLSTIQDMDRILVFHKGQLRESGTHQELLAERGLYRRLFELQYSRG
ncbi:MAG: ABC transporter ATP-binding protein [Vicinamibacterales bacterium]